MRHTQVLGKGAFGKVLLVSKVDSGLLYAMKVIHKSKLKNAQLKSHALTERKILERVQSPFVVRLHYAFQSSVKLYMVMDYMPGGELFQLIRAVGRLSEAKARFYAAEILLALEDLHQNLIIYRDLKPENVLLDGMGHVKLADFNLSKLVEDGATRTFTFCGTAEYLAPEVLRGEAQRQRSGLLGFSTVYSGSVNLRDALRPAPLLQSQQRGDVQEDLFPASPNAAVLLLRGQESASQAAPSECTCYLAPIQTRFGFRSQAAPLLR